MKKAELRSKYLKKRNEISDEEMEAISSDIASFLFQSFDFNKISSLHVFLPIKVRKEIDTWHIINKIRIAFPHIRIVVPKVKSSSEFENFLFTSETELKENAWGIAEPIDAEIFPIKKIDLVLVPLLCFDKQGHRVGYGKGFYDRFLSQCKSNTIKVGLGIFEGVESIEDSNENDVALDYCITPTGLITFSHTSHS